MKHSINTYLAEKGITPDSDQTAALEELISLLGRNISFYKKHANSGIYLWGPPGRGKSLLADCCMHAFTGPKIRLHFHEFLQSLNRQLAKNPINQSDNLPVIVDKWISPYKLICFDEFHVDDIAGSVLIGRFLKIAAFKRCRIVLTSNYEPDRLFPDPVYHSYFVPSIELIKERFTVIPLVNFNDYRTQRKFPESRCFFPINDSNIPALIKQEDPSFTINENTVVLSDRHFKIFASGENSIAFRFADLCGTHTSAIDYLELTTQWNTLFLSDIRKESFSQSAMMRFVWLLDILYDRKIKLYLTSEEPIIELVQRYFTVSHAERAVSRLTEMQHGI